MDILIVALIALAFVVAFFVGLIRAGLKFDRQRRAENNQDLADRINVGR